MKTRDQVGPDKLRGGFYTPPPLVRFCLGRLRDVAPPGALRVLEPSAGDGAFLAGLDCADAGLRERIASVTAIEVLETEAAKARRALRSARLPGSVLAGSAVAWAAGTGERFDAAIGNPPFVRYQFISRDDRAAVARLGAALGIPFRGVGNLWIPVLLGAAARVRPAGALAFVVPTECFTGVSAGIVREWLAAHVEQLRFDLFAPGSFPGVLQEVAVLSGRRGERPRTGPVAIEIVEHAGLSTRRGRSARVSPHDPSWTHCLLEPAHVEAIELARASRRVGSLGEVARLEVSTVTGANDFFCVDDATAERHDLRPWARPLLARGRSAPGLVHTPGDQRAATDEGARSWLLDFSADRPDPDGSTGPRRYLASGRARGLPARYKCRIREPWYRVPQIRVGALLLSKRSHLFPRLLLNQAAALTTDTIYRGDVLAAAPVPRADLVAGFHGSLTLLSAELEGRSFGGGVLELVPSEIARLTVPVVPGLGSHLADLDRVARSGDPEELVARTDALLGRVLAPELIGALAEGRELLLSRRLDRSVRSTARRAVAA